MTRLIANNFSTTLNGAITAIATSMTLTSVTGFPAVGSGDTCQVTLDDGAGNIEIVTATAIAGSVITITRAQESTTGFAFADLDPVEIRDTALLFTDVLASDLTPALKGPLDAALAGAYIGFGGSSTATTYCLNHSGNVPVLRGAANYWYTFTASSCDYQAGTSWYAVQMHNSNGFSVTTNNVVRIQANNSGVQFGATGARITHVNDTDAMTEDSATALCTQQSIKAYVDGPRVISATSISFDAGTNVMDVYEEGTYTVNFTDDSANTSATTTTGYYTQIGNSISVWFGVNNISTVGMVTGDVFRISVPKTAAAGPSYAGLVSADQVNTDAATVGINAFLSSGGSTCEIKQTRDALGDISTKWSDITSGATDIVAYFITYRV